MKEIEKDSSIAFSKIINKDHTRRAINESCSLLSDRLECLGYGTVFLIDKHLSHVTNSVVQPIILSKFDKEVADKIIKPILVKEAMRAEQASAQSGEMFLSISASMTSIMTRRARSKIETFDATELQVSNVISKIVENEQRFEKKHLDLLLDSIDNNKIRKIIEKAIELSGSSGTLNVSRSSSLRTLISQNEGFKFNITSNLEALSSKSWKRKNVRCFIIDGMIESVSEIHHLLEQASQNRESYVLFVRNISPEVDETIKLNLKRKTIDVIPVCVGFDENTINILNDISIACNSRIISSLKGDLISASVKRDPDIVSEIHIDESGFIIKNNSLDKNKLKNHVGFLINKMNLSNEPEKKSLISNRIRSLTCYETDIKIGKSITRDNREAIENIDKILRTIKSCCSGKIVEKSGLRKSIKSLYRDVEADKELLKIFENVINNQSEIISSQSLKLAILRSLSISKMLINTGTIMIEDR